jgi:uncharacterized DUF497 family protein
MSGRTRSTSPNTASASRRLKLVFGDPNVIVYPERNVEGEERWQAIGIAEGIVILTVSHTSRGDGGNEVVRIISARKASRTERSEYDN